MYNCLCSHVLVGVVAVGHHTIGVDVESRGQATGINHHFPLSMLRGFLVTALVRLARRSASADSHVSASQSPTGVHYDCHCLCYCIHFYLQGTYKWWIPTE